MSELRKYIDANASLPKEVVLGNLAWFEVSDGAYAAADLEAGFVRHNLNPGFLPGSINPADAYEKASKGVEGLKYPVSLGGTTGTATILVREAARTQQQIQRQLIREVKDESNRRLSYDKVGEMIFYRPTEDSAGKIDHSSARVRASLDPNLTPEERTMLGDLITKFNADFDRYRNFHDGQKMRGVMRNYLRYLNGVLMKSAVYFVHVNRADELTRLQAFAKELTGVEVALWQIPDISFHREEVIEACQDEAVKELNLVFTDIQKMREARKGGVISFTQYGKFKDRADEILRRSAEHSRTMQIAQDRTGDAVDLVMDALVALRTEIYNANMGDAQ